MVVHGDGTDEITITGETRVFELYDGTISQYTLTPEEFGISRVSRDAITGGTPAENAQTIREIFSGRKGPCRDIVLLNAAAAIYLGEKASCLYDGYDIACNVVDSGKAKHLLRSLCPGEAS